MPKRTMTIAYCVALTLIAVAACCGYFAIRWAVDHAAVQQGVVQALNEQKAATTDIVDQLERYVDSGPTAAQAAAESELFGSLDELSGRHTKMRGGRFGDVKLEAFEPENYPAYFHGENSLFTLMSQFQNEVRALVALEVQQNIDARHPQAQRVLNELPKKIMQQLRVVVSAHESAAKMRLERAVRTSGLSVLALLVILVFEGLFIFRPLTSAVYRKQTELEDLNASLEHTASYDHLTQILNRSKFPEIAAQECSRARRNQRPVCCLLLDVDHFKAVNDTHGHAVGDGVLCNIAETLSGTARSVDYVLRWGGEEFLVLMPDCDLDSCLIAAERFRKAVEGAVSSDGISVTISLGGAITDGSEVMDHVIERADKALYAAKNKGRNRVEIA